MASFEHDKLSLSHTFDRNRKRVELKSGPGRGRKTVEWVLWLHGLLHDDFKWFKATRLKFSLRVLLLVVRNVLLTNPHPRLLPNVSPDNDPQPLIERIIARWIQQFQETHTIVHQTQTRKLMVSPAKTKFIEHSVAYHMGILARAFFSSKLDENLQENIDETHFIMNMDNKHSWLQR